MVSVNEYKIRVENTLQEERYNLTINPLAYTLPIALEPEGPGELGATTIPIDRPVNNKHFSLSGKTEPGNIPFQAFERFNPSTIDSVYNDRSYDPANNTHTLDALITALENSVESGSDTEAAKLKARFQQDSNDNYVVRSVKEQRIWFKEIIQNPGLNTDWTLFGGTYDFRTVDGSNNNTGTPIFLETADIIPSENSEAIGTGVFRFKVGGRL